MHQSNLFLLTELTLDKTLKLLVQDSTNEDHEDQINVVQDKPASNVLKPLPSGEAM